MKPDDTLLATLDCARSDYDNEMRRASAIDAKLTNIAAFSGVSLAISGTLGGSVLVQGKVDADFAIHIGIFLGLAILFLAVGVIICFRGLIPADFEGIDLDAAKDRVRPQRLDEDDDAVKALVSTYYLRLLPAARAVNDGKAATLTKAYWCVQIGFATLAVGLVLTVIAALV